MSSESIRLAEAVLHRRIELALSQLEVAAAGGPSNTKLTEIENGRLESLTPATAKKLDKGLQWAAGSAMTVWRGGEATVGADGKGDGYVSREPRTGEEEVRDAASDNAVLDAIQQMQRDMQAMEQRLSERLERLEQPDA